MKKTNTCENSENNSFKRDHILSKLSPSTTWDVIIIGGGATGLGTALDASSRGLKTLLLEQADFANGTSSRSTKLVHGGVRYLAQGNLGLVMDALKERGLMIKNAPHLVKMLPFIIPSYKAWDKYYYGIGLKIYDWMAKSLRFQKTKFLSREETLLHLPNLNTESLNGGVLYFDGQFDDTRLAINLAQSAAEQGADLLNYFEVTALSKDKDKKITGVKAKDIETGNSYNLKSKVVINATGVFVDNILKMNDSSKTPLVKASQGIHLVLDKSFMKSDHALMIPSTSDGRVLFALPWHEHLLVGTTDTPVEHHLLEPSALDSEIDFILNNLEEYLAKKPSKKDILSVFAGLRPLVQPSKDKGTKEISRDHKLTVSRSKLITITGGKWTTYRKMAEDTVDLAIETGNLKNIPSKTDHLKVHGATREVIGNYLDIYGSDAKLIMKLARDEPKLQERLHPEFPVIKAEVVWAARKEMARTIEDFLARRTRLLFLNARAAIDAAEETAKIMADVLGRDTSWIDHQTKNFIKMAQKYLPEPYNPVKPKSKEIETK